MRPELDDAFGRLLTALQPFLNEMVIVGGWAHRLYRYDSEAVIPAHEPLFTTDTDIAIPPGADLPPNQLLERLRLHGFFEDLQGEENPPVAHYRLGDEKSEFYAEFLAPLAGGGGRPGKKKGHTETLSGVVVQRLQHVDVLLIEPWPIAVRSGAGEQVLVRVPNAVTYIAQKLLILGRRKPSERPKDLLYIHDTIELFGAALDRLALLWQTTIRTRLGGNASKVEKLALTQFGEVTDDIRTAVRMAAGRDLDPEAFRLRCAVGLEMIFGANR